MQRRLVTIMVGDVVGYSRMMEAAEEQTAQQMQACQDLVTETVEAAGGRVFNRAGDAALAEFDSPVNAVRAASDIREKLTGLSFANNNEMKMRFGLHLADVMVSGDDLLGDGVNLAARIQQQAEPDTINISEAVFDQIKRHSPFTFDDLGAQSFKNITDPIRVFRLTGQMGYHRLQSAPTRSAAQRSASPNSIAVLPFTSSGNDEDQQFLAEGLTDEIILELARFKKLQVASRSCSFVYAGQNIDAAKAARELGVSYILQGQVRRMGDTIRLSFELANGSTGISVWADRITRKFEDLFDVMETATTQIAATILGRVEADLIDTARRKPPENMSGYEMMLRGLDLHRLGNVTYDHPREAVKWFDKAIEADPSYGPAYAWRICSSSWLPEFDLDNEKYFIEKALDLDPNNPEAQRIMGVISMLEGDFEAARIHNEKALELSPWDAYVLARCAAFYTFNGEPDKALQLLDKAEALDALMPVWCIEERGIAHYAKGNFELAVTAFMELSRRTARSQLYLCAALMALDRKPEAEAAMKKALVINPDLTSDSFVSKETWRDHEKKLKLRRDLIAAGLPKN
jgi:adenylate cyclase